MAFDFTSLLKGAGTGAATGAVGGPAGAGIGAAVGVLSSLFGSKKNPQSNQVSNVLNMVEAQNIQAVNKFNEVLAGQKQKTIYIAGGVAAVAGVIIYLISKK